MREAMFFTNKFNPDPNIFIGGAGLTINTPELLAQEFSISESNIFSFEVDISNNISCYVGVDFKTINGGGFANNTEITYFIDTEGNLISVDSFASFSNCSNLKYFYAPNIGDVGFVGAQGAFLSGGIALEKINIENATKGDGRNSLRQTNISKLDLRNLTTLTLLDNPTYNLGQNLNNLQRLFIGNVLTCSIVYGQEFKYFAELNMGCKVYYNSNLGVMDRNSWSLIYFTSFGIGVNCTINGLNYVGVNGLPANDGEFDITTTGTNGVINSLKDAINNDTRIGTLGIVTATVVTRDINGSVIQLLGLVSDQFGSSGDNTTISIGSAAVATLPRGINFIGGNDIHFTLMYLRDERSATLIEVGLPISVNSPTNLSSSNQTATSVDLNFTIPIANANGNDGYEVWVDDGTVFRKWFEFTEILSSGDTLDLTDVFNDVGTISGTKIKIRTIDGHYNFSDFSNEITLL